MLPIGLKPSLRAGLAFCKSPTLSLRMIGQANSMPLVLKGRLPTEPSFLGNIQHGIDRKSCGQCVSRACFSSMEGATLGVSRLSYRNRSRVVWVDQSWIWGFVFSIFDGDLFSPTSICVAAGSF